LIEQLYATLWQLKDYFGLEHRHRRAKILSGLL